jgi:hypothetical protein
MAAVKYAVTLPALEEHIATIFRVEVNDRGSIFL